MSAIKSRPRRTPKVPFKMRSIQNGDSNDSIEAERVGQTAVLSLASNGYEDISSDSNSSFDAAELEQVYGPPSEWGCGRCGRQVNQILKTRFLHLIGKLTLCVARWRTRRRVCSVTGRAGAGSTPSAATSRPAPTGGWSGRRPRGDTVSGCVQVPPHLTITTHTSTTRVNNVAHLNNTLFMFRLQPEHHQPAPHPPGPAQRGAPQLRPRPGDQNPAGGQTDEEGEQEEPPGRDAAPLLRHQGRSSPGPPRPCYCYLDPGQRGHGQEAAEDGSRPQHPGQRRYGQQPAVAMFRCG